MIPAPRLAGVSVDVDSVATHLAGYGIHGAEDDGANYAIAVPRAVDLFGGTGAKATFFLIAEEAARHPEVVRAIVDAGHEVACHSMTHRLPFDVSDPQRARLEIVEARELLESLSGARVSGFRAPSWGVSPTLLARLHDAGYRYDASSFPSWMLFVLRWSVARRGSPGQARLASSIRQGLLARPSPHVASGSWGRLVEIPMSTAPVARLAYYHTMRFLLPDLVFRAMGRAARARRGVATYIFHAVDFLDVDRDGLDRRIARHPGMDRGLEHKLRIAERSLAELYRGREPATLGTIADAFLPER